jgi:hypothetical protein
LLPEQKIPAQKFLQSSFLFYLDQSTYIFLL